MTEPDLESLICDMPRWTHIICTLLDAKFAPGMDAKDEADEAIVLAVDEMHRRAVELRDLYLRDTYVEKLDGTSAEKLSD